VKSSLFAAISTLLFVFSLAETTVAAAAGKVEVCHLEGNGSYHLISVSENAKAAHMRHGDGLPGDHVPGVGSFVGDTTMAQTGYGQVNLEFNGGGATFQNDCGRNGAATGSLTWDRVTEQINSWSGPIVDVHFAGDGQTVDFTVRVDSAPTGPNLVGCDIAFQVVEGVCTAEIVRRRKRRLARQ
jgi:hypothetical protein